MTEVEKITQSEENVDNIIVEDLKSLKANSSRNIERYKPEVFNSGFTTQLNFKKIGAKYYFPHHPDKYLTKCEYKVFNCYLNGYISAKNIGDKLLLSHRTVEFHFANVQKKLDCSSKFEIRKQALHFGLMY